MNKLKLTAIALAFVLYGCSGKNSKLIKVSGTVEAVEVTVRAEVGGKIIDLNFDEGEKVDSGFVLCQVDTSLLYQRLLSAEAEVDMAFQRYKLLLKGARREEIEAMEKAVLKAKIMLQNAKKQFERTKNLFKTGAVTEDQYDNARTKYETLKAQYEELLKKLEILKKGSRVEEIKIAEANYKRAVANLQSIKIQIEKSKIKAPISGYIITKYVELGEVVSPGVPIAKMANLDEVYVRAYVPEKYLDFIKLGDDVKIITDAGNVLSGRVVFISPEAEFTPKNIQMKEEREKLVYAIKIKVKNKNEVLKIGMPVDVVIKKSGV